MGQFDVYIFLTHCYIPASIQVNSDILIQPYHGMGAADIVELMDCYLKENLQNEYIPQKTKKALSSDNKSKDSSIIITISNILANNHYEAINITESPVLICRDILAFRQLQRGNIASFLSIQTDVSPLNFYPYIRPPYHSIRKVTNIPIGETESDIFTRYFTKVQHYPILQVYLSLYADSTTYSDTLPSNIGNETRLLKLWTLLETMAYSERGSKKEKVKKLFKHFNLSTYPDYLGHAGKDLLDIAYDWRNIIAHSGSCTSANDEKDKKFCNDYSTDLPKLLEELNQSCRFLLNAFANSLL